MDRPVKRILVLSLALFPALGLAFTTPAPVYGALGALAPLVALAAAFRSLPASPDMMLLHPAARRRVSDRLPDLETQRAALATALAWGPSASGWPPSRAEAVAALLQRCLVAWNAPGIAGLEAERVLALHLLTRLLHGTPGEAGELAQLFRRPDTVLAIRDEIDAMATARAAFDRDTQIFRATTERFTTQGNTPATGLLDALQRLDAPDIDLWHHVVLAHDSADPDQGAAALWCVQQPECDRATVAVYLAQVSQNGRLVQAARTGDAPFLEAMRDIIQGWNAKTYTTRELALEPTDVLCAAASEFGATLLEVQRITGQSWPRVSGAFVPHTGRAPRSRTLWDLKTGLLRQAPRRFDYFDTRA